jgi:hypothetical protein
VQHAVEDIRSPDGIDELVLRHDVQRIAVPLHVGNFAQALDRAGMHGLRNEDARPHVLALSQITQA